MINLIPCGTLVRTVIGNIECMITGTTIRFNNVAYELTYFTNNEQKTIWTNESEFKVETISRTSIGFKK